MRRIKRIKHLEKENEILGRKVYKLERDSEVYRKQLDLILSNLFENFFTIGTGIPLKIKAQFKK